MSTRLGPISLSICVGGFLVSELLIHQGILANPWWHVLAAGFEAGTIGALADWFAVSALFREVPLPLLRRHTNILVRNRRRFTAALTGYVQNQLLAPAVIRERLAQVPFAQSLLAVLAQPEQRAYLQRMGRELAVDLIRALDEDRIVAGVTALVRTSLGTVEVATPVGHALEASLLRGDHHGLWAIASDKAALLLRREQTTSELGTVLKAAIRDYAQGGLAAKVLVWISEALSATDYERMAGAIVARAVAWLAVVRDDPQHPFRVEADAILHSSACALRDGDPALRSGVERLRSGMLAQAELEEPVRTLLADLRRRLSDSLGDPRSQLAQALDERIDRLIAGVASNAALLSQLDDALRSLAAAFLERNHHVIGEIVASSLSPERVRDEALVAQIEDKVGDDLQYIRLNGAVVGGLVGVVIGVVRQLVG